MQFKLQSETIYFTLGFSVFLAILLSGCALPRQVAPGQVTQWAVYRPAAVASGDHLPTLADMLRYGDTGLGYLSPIDGELVVDRGQAFQVRADGRVHQPPPNARLATAIVCPFQLDRAVRMPSGAGLTELRRELEHQAPDTDTISAFRLVGRFERIESTAPEPLRDEALPPRMRTQPFTRVSGVMIGFRLPDVAPGLQAPGLHMVFISQDRLNGGRVTDFELIDGILEVHLTDRFLFIQPKL